MNRLAFDYGVKSCMLYWVYLVVESMWSTVETLLYDVETLLYDVESLLYIVESLLIIDYRVVESYMTRWEVTYSEPSNYHQEI